MTEVTPARSQKQSDLSHRGRRPSWLVDDLTNKLRSYDRTPFMELLAYWMECAPTHEEIEAFARKKPDMWVKALTDLAKVSGYSDKQEVLHTFRVDQLSDSQLEDQANALARKLGFEKLIDITPEPVKSDVATPAQEKSDA